VKFSYLPSIDNNNYTTAVDFSVTNPEWVSAIKNTAFNSYFAAFKQFPAIIQGHYLPTWLPGGSDNLPFRHTIYVTGVWVPTEATGLGCPINGKTDSNSWSRVYYLALMCGAQFNLGDYRQTNMFRPPINDKSAMLELVTGIGKAIGNVGAHETAHQLSFSILVPGLDCGNENKPCQNNIDSVYEFYKDSEWNYKDVTPPIHWEDNDSCNIQRFLLQDKNLPCKK
jgi:hypothetical protein